MKKKNGGWQKRSEEKSILPTPNRMQSERIYRCTNVSWGMKMILAVFGWLTTMNLSRGAIYPVVGPASTIHRHHHNRHLVFRAPIKHLQPQQRPKWPTHQPPQQHHQTTLLAIWHHSKHLVKKTKKKSKNQKKKHQQKTNIK